jgi:membrane fusion protein, multidrug efflux system
MMVDVMKIKILLIIIIFFASCTKQEPQSPGFPVKIASVTEEDIPYFLKGVGQLNPSLLVEMKAQVSGILTNVLFSDGQLAEEADLLMTIDQRIYEATVQQATAQLEEDQARLRYALEFAETYGKLVGKDYVSRLEYEEAIQNVDAYKAAVELDMATLKRAQVNLDYTQMRAPFKGYLGLRKYDPGNYVDAAAGEILVTLRKITPLSVKFFIPAEYLQEIREKQKETPLYLEAELPGDSAHPLQGSLWFIDNSVNAQTGMILLEGTIPNLEEKGWPGQFVRVHLRLKILDDAIVIPQQALVIGEKGHFVYVLDENDMTVHMKMVGKGIVYQNDVVIFWGLEKGEKVVIDGQLNLHEGVKVYLVEEKEPA